MTPPRPRRGGGGDGPHSIAAAQEATARAAYKGRPPDPGQQRNPPESESGPSSRDPDGDHDGPTDPDGGAEPILPNWLPEGVAERLPDEWGAGQAVKKKDGWRWFDPDQPSAAGVRIDRGNPNSPLPSQQVDHVIVRRDGVVIGRDGQPISGSIKDDPVNAHIPLSEWLQWSRWDHP